MRELALSIGRVSASAGEASVDIDPRLEVFAGHFPGNPILPGVMLTDLVITAAARMFPQLREEDFCGLAAMKFKAPVRPGELIVLRIECNASGASFVVLRGEDVCAEGRLLYGASA